jgi:hypothetical protein
MNIFFPILIILSGLLFAGSVSSSLVPKNSIRNNPQPTVTNYVLGTSTQVPTPSVTPTPTKQVVIPTSKPILTSIPTLSPTPTNIPSQTIITIVITPTPSPTAVPTPTSSPTPTLIPTLIIVEVKEPNHDFTFPLSIQDGINACQLLEFAKDQGKINSVTLDDRYLSSFNTLLVKEINGFQDNWTFTVNGNSPMGCSLINLHNNDSVVWEYVTF